MSEHDEWQALIDADLDLLPKEAVIASVKQLAARLLELSPRTDRYWHGYQAEIPELLEDSVGPVVGFTVVAESPLPGEEAPKVHLGTIFGRELVFKYVCTWDHQPTEAEREEAQLAQFQLAKEKQGNDNAGSGSEQGGGA